MFSASRGARQADFFEPPSLPRALTSSATLGGAPMIRASLFSALMLLSSCGDSSAGESPNTGASGAGGETTSADRPYANVTAVSVAGAAEAYSFAVSVESADIDCTQYADWWEVLSEDGSLVFRRILEHAHTDENGTSDPDAPGNTFTRDGGPIALAPDEVVVVRAHMNTTGYNGTAMRGSAVLGFEEAPDIGSDFAAAVEELEPQPQTCLF
jgi:hypothetical protein